MKKLISCLLVVMMLLMAVSAFAESSGTGRFGESNAVTRFVKATDFQTKDLALQIQSGDQVDDLVIRVDGDNLHLVSRNNNTENGHIQLNPTGIYVSDEGNVTLLRYATIIAVNNDIAKAVESTLDEIIKSLPEVEEPSKAEMKKAQKQLKKAVEQLAILAAAEEAQEQEDAAVLSSAAMSFVGKFKPEYILDVKEEYGTVEISLRSEAFASALADAMDELMSNPELAELVDRTAALEGGKEFSRYQKNWAKNREATLEAIRSIKSTETASENGHMTSHFQIGEEDSAVKVLVCDTDSWIDAEGGKADIKVALGFENEDPLLVYELSVYPDYYSERLTSGNSMADVQMSFDNDQITGGKVICVIEGEELMRFEIGSDYLYMKGPNGAISTSVRETWTGKTRYELVAETADGQEGSITLDFYEYDDSLISELSTSESDQTVQFKLSRIDKVNIDDLSASENLNEITAEMIKTELENIVKAALPAAKADK